MKPTARRRQRRPCPPADSQAVAMARTVHTCLLIMGGRGRNGAGSGPAPVPRLAGGRDARLVGIPSASSLLDEARPDPTTAFSRLGAMAVGVTSGDVGLHADVLHPDAYGIQEQTSTRGLEDGELDPGRG